MTDGRRSRRYAALAAGVLLFLAGCRTQAGGPEVTERLRETVPPVAMPDVTPLAMVDQNGYRTGAEKIVVFTGRNPGETFEVRAAENDAVVYTGSIREHGTDVYTGRFSSYQTAGRYYIYTEATGSSYAFVISDTLDQVLGADALQCLSGMRCGGEGDARAEGALYRACHTEEARLKSDPSVTMDVRGGWHTAPDGSRSVTDGCRALRTLLLSHEIHTASHGDADGITESGNGIPDILDEAAYEAAWLLKLQNGQGGVHAGVLTGGNENSANLTVDDATQEAALYFAGAMARFAYAYETFDAAFAQSALAASQAAFAAASEEGNLHTNRAAFAAAAELYRITGERQYEAVLSTFFGREDFRTLFTEDEDIFFGGITYLMTRQPVNVEVCDTIMDVLLSATGTIANRAEADAWYVSEYDTDRMLSDMEKLAVANYVIYNHEYAGILENHIHYLAGRNPRAVNYTGSETARTYRDSGESGIPDTPGRSAGLVLMLGGT